MSYYERKCEKCGNTYITGDEYCRSCNAPLPVTEISDAELLDGMHKSDWHIFIDKNSSRYTDIFAQNEGKKIFFHMNWAAFFFGLCWLFYRKMYKYGIIFLIVSTLFHFTVSVGLVAAYKGDIIAAARLMEPYEDYIQAGDNYYSFATDGTVDIEKMDDSYRESKKILNSVTAKMYFWAILFSLIFNLFFALLADCIYRRYVTQKCGCTSGGTSIPAVIGIIVFNGIFDEVITNAFLEPIIEMILK